MINVTGPTVSLTDWEQGPFSLSAWSSGSNWFLFCRQDTWNGYQISGCGSGERHGLALPIYISNRECVYFDIKKCPLILLFLWRVKTTDAVNNKTGSLTRLFWCSARLGRKRFGYFCNRLQVVDWRVLASADTFSVVRCMCNNNISLVCQLASNCCRNQLVLLLHDVAMQRAKRRRCDARRRC